MRPQFYQFQKELREFSFSVGKFNVNEWRTLTCFRVSGLCMSIPEYHTASANTEVEKHRHRCQRLGRKRVVLRILRVESCSGDQDTVPDDESCAEKSVTIFEWVWENGVPTHIKNSRLVPTTKSHDIEWMCDGVDVAGSWPHIHRPRKTSHAKTPRVIISNHVSRIRLAIRKRFQTYNSLIVNSYLFDFCYWKLLEAGNILELEVEFVLLPVSTRNEDTILLVLAHTTEWQLSITNISVRTATWTS